MEHPDFVAWMVFFPLASAAADALRWRFCERKSYSDAVRGLAALMMMCIWFGVGAKLY